MKYRWARRHKARIKAQRDKRPRPQAKCKKDLFDIEVQLRHFVEEYHDDEYMLRQIGERALKAFPPGFFDAEYDYNIDKTAEMVLARQ